MDFMRGNVQILLYLKKFVIGKIWKAASQMGYLMEKMFSTKFKATVP